MKIALIGWTNPQNDLSILLDCYQILKPVKITNYDFIDLNRGRDFLKEDKTYDIVILIYIFIATAEEMRNESPYWPDDPLTKTSPLHSKENWRTRLLATQAKEILVFGMFESSEITGRYLGDLASYVTSEIELRSSKGIYGKVWRYSKNIEYTNHDCESINNRD